MTRRTFVFVAGRTALAAADKKPPQGQVEDDTVSITATLLNADQLRQAVGSDFDNNYTVLDVRVSPKGGIPYVLTLEDFVLRSESSGEHSGPFLSAGQIAGDGALVLTRTYGNRSGPDNPRPLEGSKIEMKADAKSDSGLEALKKKMLASKNITEPVSGLMFFPLSPKEKAKNLILSCTTPKGHLRMSFK